jgi:hypothetical protein
MALGSTQPLTEMSIRNIPGGEGRPARKAVNLTAICEPIVYKNVGALTSHSPMNLHGPLQGYLYLFRCLHDKLQLVFHIYKLSSNIITVLSMLETFY